MDAFCSVKVDNIVPDFILKFANLLKCRDEDNLFKIFSSDAVLKLYHSRLDKQAYTKQHPSTILNFILTNPLYFSESTLYYDSIDSFFDENGNLIIIAVGCLSIKNNQNLPILDTFYLKNWSTSQKNAGWSLYCFQRRHLCHETFRPEMLQSQPIAQSTAPIQATPEARFEPETDTVYYSLDIFDFVQNSEFESDLKNTIQPIVAISCRVITDRENKRKLMIRVKKSDTEQLIAKLKGFKIRDSELKDCEINPKIQSKTWKKGDKKHIKK